ncbi:MAG: hypothetical protein IJQ83_01215 [Bacteroidales bacterium]|nr:hypothetical protein [Bacteroidales bacterium]
MKRTLITIFLACLTFSVFAQEWTSINGNVPSTIKTELISSTESMIQVHVQVPGYYATTVATPRGESYVISLPKAVSTAHAGEPDMPMTGIPVMIGDKSRMDVRVIDAQYTDYEGIEVAPSKGDFPRTIDPATVPYTYGDCYSQDAFFPANNVGLYEPYIIRDFRGQNMAVYPFAYNPVTKTLRVYYDMTLEMYKVDDNGINSMETRRSNVVKMDPDFKSLYQRHFINFEAAMNRYTPVDEDGDLLIICYDNFISNMTDFVNWKKTRGMNTTIVGTSTAGTTYSAIKTYIQNQYNANNNLAFVLLVGDVAQIPGYTYTGGGSSYSGLGDNAYGQVVGNDVYNDIFIGRFSASSATQVNNQVQKVLTYERDLTTSDTWCQNGLGVSTTAGSGGHYNEDDYQHIENLRTDLLNYGYNTVYQDYYNVSGYPSSSTTTISNHINSGVGIINYCNHGSETSWQSHSYSNSHVNALTNSNKLPFIFSVACLNGKYDYSSDCFGEAWMHATNNTTGAPTGAIGGMFSYISQPWIPPMWAQDEFVDILVESYSNNIKRTSGGAAINGLMAIFDNYSTTETSAVGTYQAWIHYGDPSQVLRTKTPQAMTVTHNGSIQPAVTNYTVNVTNGNGALATITNANHEILGKATVSNNTATINITGTLTPGEELTLCVFGYNKVTYLGTIQVIASEGPYVVVDSYTPTIANVGVQTNLSLVFKNLGTQATSGNSTVTLSCDNSSVTFGTFTKNFSSLAVDATTTVSGFSFTIAEGVADGTVIPITVTITNGNDIWESTANITAVAPDLVVGAITDSELIPGESGTITFPVTNSGSAAAQNVVLTLSCNNGNITFGTNPVTVSSIAAGATTNITVNVNVASSVTYGSALTFSYTLTADHFATNGTYNTTAGIVETAIGSGTSTNAYLPTYAYYNYSLVEQIYTATEIGQACTITAIAFKVSNSKSATRALDLYMVHTTKTAFSGNSDWVSLSTSNKVFSGEVTFSASGWTTITLDTPFAYNGTDNLIIGVDDNTGSYVSPSSNCPAFYAYSTDANRALYKYNDNTNYNPASMSTSGTRLTSNNQIQLTIIPNGPTTELPTVTTTAVSNIAPTTAMSGGNVIADGGADITARGICWSTSQTPTISGNHTTDGTGTGSFNSTMTGLTPNTTYYVRAYATNSEGTAYGEVVSFTTMEQNLVGDVNEDGVISIDDVSVLLSHILGNISLTDQALINADVNGDGVISIDDVSTLLNMSMR